MTKNHVNAVYMRIPLLASLHTYKRGGNGFHLEAGVVGGFLLQGQYIFEQKNLSIQEYKREDFPVNPFQLHGRMAIGFGKMSLLGEVGLLPIFDESPLDTPGMQSFQWVCSTDSAIDNGALKIGICELWLHRSVGTA